MANVLKNPMVLDTAAATNLGQDHPIKVQKIVWTGTTIVAGNAVKICRGDDNTTVLWQLTASNADVQGGTTFQRITADFATPMILPSKNGLGGGWTLNTLSSGTLTIHYAV
jgi:hypothetical protein